jgi:hypothetical protein
MSIKTILQEAKLKNILVSIYDDIDDWSCCSVGYVDIVTDTHVRLCALSRHGKPAGLEIRCLSEIFKVEYDGKYEKKIQALAENQQRIFNQVELNDASSDNLIVDTLRQAKDNSAVIVVWGKDPSDSLVGYVESIDPEVVTMRLIDDFGDEDGMSAINIDEITDIDFNTLSEQVINFLYKNKKSNN